MLTNSHSKSPGNPRRSGGALLRHWKSVACVRCHNLTDIATAGARVKNREYLGLEGREHEPDATRAAVHHYRVATPSLSRLAAAQLESHLYGGTHLQIEGIGIELQEHALETGVVGSAQGYRPALSAH